MTSLWRIAAVGCLFLGLAFAQDGRPKPDWPTSSERGHVVFARHVGRSLFGPSHGPVVYGDRWYAGVDGDGNAAIWDTRSGARWQRVGSIGWVVAMAGAGHGRLVLGTDDGKVALWDIGSAEYAWTRAGAHKEKVRVVRSIGDTILTVGGAGTSHVWDAATGKRIRSFDVGSDAKHVVLADHKGGRILVSRSRTIEEWSAVSGKKLRRICTLARDTRSLAYAAPGLVLCGGPRGGIVVVDVKSGRTLRTLEGGRGSLRSMATRDELGLAVSADGRVAAPAPVCARGRGVTGDRLRGVGS